VPGGWADPGREGRGRRAKRKRPGGEEGKRTGQAGGRNREDGGSASATGEFRRERESEREREVRQGGKVRESKPGRDGGGGAARRGHVQSDPVKLKAGEGSRNIPEQGCTSDGGERKREAAEGRLLGPDGEGEEVG